jgi:hypothetical protein
MTRTSFHYFSDPSHGWLRVTEDDLKELGLNRGQFSPYSYCDGPRVYLEEDLDASLFLAAYEAKHGKRPEIIERRENAASLVRNLPANPANAYTYDAAMALLKGFRAQIDAAA